MPERTKVAICGFTTHMQFAPWQDNDWEIWGLNDLHGMMVQYAPDLFKSDRVQWFQLHRDNSGTDGNFHGVRDPEHRKWLTEAKCPIWMWEAHPDVPNAKAYPLHEVLTKHLLPHGKPMSEEAYYNNSISWMIAKAILDGYKTIAVFGVDMAIDGVHGQSEYGHQRPSVEYFIGVARGLGIDVVLHPESEICKCAFLYGFDNEQFVRRKLLRRIEQLTNDDAGLVQQYEAIKRTLHELRGAKAERLDGLRRLRLEQIIEQKEKADTPDALDELFGSVLAASDPRLQELSNKEEQAVAEYEHVKRMLHEVRGARNNTEWLLRNYFPGEGPVQDLQRTPDSLVIEPSGNGWHNRLTALERADAVEIYSRMQGVRT